MGDTPVPNRGERPPAGAAALSVHRRISTPCPRLSPTLACVSRPTKRVDGDETRGRVHWVTVVLGVLGGAALLVALVWAVIIVYTWVTDGIGA